MASAIAFSNAPLVRMSWGRRPVRSISTTAAPARSRVVLTATVDGGRRRRAGQRQSERLADRAHRVGGEHAAAGPLARAGVLLDRVQLLLGDRAGRTGADRLEHRRDVERLAVEVPRHDRTVVDEHARQVEAVRSPSSSPASTCRSRPVATSPSSRSPCITHSTESAMISRLTSEARMPSCPIEMPSDTVIVPNSSATPPARRTPSLAAAVSRRIDMLHGVISFHDDAMPTCGLSQSSSVRPDGAQHRPGRGLLDAVGHVARAGLDVDAGLGAFRHGHESSGDRCPRSWCGEHQRP